MLKIEMNMPNSCMECKFKKHLSYEYWECYVDVSVAMCDDSMDFSATRHQRCPLIEIVEEQTCTTCKNNQEFPPPHTCDICNSLDEEFGCMYERREKDGK